MHVIVQKLGLRVGHEVARVTEVKITAHGCGAVMGRVHVAFTMLGELLSTGRASAERNWSRIACLPDVARLEMAPPGGS